MILSHDQIKRNIRASFSRNVDNYDKLAEVQRQAAQILLDTTLDRIIVLAQQHGYSSDHRHELDCSGALLLAMTSCDDSPSSSLFAARGNPSQACDITVRSILEIGCGTGFLSQLILDRFKQAQVFISDLSIEMVTSCRSAGPATYLVCDGESLPFAKSFRPELVMANMSLHWFQSFEESLCKLFDITSGVLAFSIPVLGTFKAWELAHQKLEINNRMLQFYSLNRLEQILSGLKPKNLFIKTIQLSQPVGSGLEFLRHLRAIGASPNIKQKVDAYSVAELSALCREVDKHQPEEITNYELAICILER